MKQRLLLILFILGGLLPLPIVARDFTYTNEGKTITYTVIDEVAKTCMVAGNQSVTGAVILPANPLDGEIQFTLTGISENAFRELSELTEVVIPETVTRIGTSAFQLSGIEALTIPNTVTELGESLCRGCKSLVSVSIGKSVKDIPKYAFLSCDALEEITLPEGLVSIGTQAFSYCDGLKSFTIPDSVSAFGSFLFYGCNSIEWIYIGSLVQENSLASIVDGVTNLKEFKVSEANPQFAAKDGVLFNKTLTSLLRYPCGQTGAYVIPSSVEIISDYAFQGSKVESIDIPNNLVTIGQGAFNNAVNLASIVIPASVKEIGESAFNSCLQLTEVTIKGNLPVLGAYAFSNCPMLKTFSIDDSNYVVKDGVLFDKDFTTLITCIGTIEGEYKIPDTVTEIADGAFYQCNELTAVTIPSSVTKIGKEAFTSCSALEAVEIPNSVEFIGEDAFADCSGLKSFNIPNSLQAIGQDALWGCPLLETITIGNAVSENVIFRVNETSSIKGYCIDGESQKYAVKDGVLFNKSLSKLIVYPLGLGGDYVIPSTVDSIGNRAFLSSTITSITIPNSVTVIGKDAFQNSNYFKSVIIPESVKEIGNAGFYGCEALESVTIKGSLPVLGAGAFGACDLLNTFIIEDDNYVVKDGILFNKNLTKLVTCLGTTEGDYEIPETVTEIGGGAFEGSNFSTIEIPTSVVTIGERAFSSTNNLGSVKIPDSVESMGEAVFLGSGLTSAELSNSLTSIEFAAFQQCFKLESIKLGNSITSIDGSAFMGSKNLKKVYAPSIESWLAINFEGEYGNPLCYGAELIIDNTNTEAVEIPVGTEEVSDYAFAGLKDLVEVVISNTVEKIGSGSFTGTGLENVNIPQTVKEIGEKAFQDCKSLLSAVIGKISGKLTRAAEVDESNLTTIGNEAFSGCENLNKVSIGSNVGSIGELAFAGCGSISRVDCYSLIAPDAADDAFDAAIYSQAELHVPTGYADVFENAPVWSSFSKIVADLDAPETLTLDIEEKTLKIGASLQLTATSSTEDILTWESSDEEIATVSAEGLVKALQVGVVKITVTASSGARAYCEITVVPIEVEGISLDVTEKTIKEEETLQLTATVTPADATNQSITWSSSDETVATVDQTGLVTALKAGKATITAQTVNGLKATCVITVEAKSGVDGVEADAQISVVASEGAIVVTAPDGAEVEVYSLTGIRVAKTREHRVEGLSKGVYIVTVGGKAFKVIVK